jgi:UDP-N-acetylmuramoyl-L-alanyl-D-glutamate--2,6-diaminopimelate ligase
MVDVAGHLPTVSIKGRFESVSALPYAAFIIDYAHNGISLTSALTALREYTEGRLICLFGSVGGRTKGRRRELGDAAAALADLSIITADNPDSEPPESVIADIERSFTEAGKQKGVDYVTFPDRRDAIRYAVREAERGDVILLAGKGHEDYQLIDGIELPFSERAIITEAAIEIGELV